MKRNNTSILLLLLMILAVSVPTVPVRAADTDSTEVQELEPETEDADIETQEPESGDAEEESDDYFYELAYDGTEMLDKSSVSLETEELNKISEKYRIEFRLDIVTDTGDYELGDVANYYYDEYNYGHSETGDGVLLMLQLEPGETDVSFVDYYFLYDGEREDLYDFCSALYVAIQEQLTEEAWAGNMDDDNESFRLMMHRYVDAANTFFGGETVLSDNADLAGLKDNYIVDLGDLVSDSEEAALTAEAQDIADTYDFGVYIVTVPNYADYGISINDCAKNIYRDCDLGVGEGKDGFILCMSTDDRDYSFLAYGDFGNYALTEFAFDMISSSFKGQFKEDKWYRGFQEYHSESRTALQKAKDGDPWSADNDLATNILINCLIFIPCLLIGLVLAFFVNGRLMDIMKPVKEASRASSFVDRQKVKITVHKDRYINTTRTRKYNPPSRSSSSSGGSDYGSSGSSGGGFSGGSGKY